MRENSIGIFDSGIGGLSVLCECFGTLPHESYIYLKDSANMPYGNKRAEDIVSAAKYCCDTLFGMDCKAVVIACNTATAVAAETLRSCYPDKIIIGLEPAVKPCAKELGARGYAVALVTKATGNSAKFNRLTAACGGKIVPVVAEGLAEKIEENFGSVENVREYVYGLLEPYRDAESVVLGCSHYSYIINIVRRFYNGNIKIYDGAKGAAVRLKYCLELSDLINDRTEKGSVRFLKTIGK